jgi:7-carboxy-7-deazaguanine synthase
MAPHARLVEVFSSIQGESELVGYRQIFLRFFGCNLHCDYCDSPEAHRAAEGPAWCRVERTPGSSDCDRLSNPLSPADVCDAVARLNTVPHHSVSLTGGEPLIHALFLEALLPELRGLGLPVYLETNGTLPESLERVLEWVDFIGMDVKLPSVAGTDAASLLPRHQAFLTVARRRRVFVKIVVGAETPASEVDEAARMVAAVDRAIPLTLQPVTPFGGVARAPAPAKLLELQALALRFLETVRVIPQTHKMLNVR